MSATPKTLIIDPAKPPAGIEFPVELLTHVAVEKLPTNIAGHYGFRVRCLADDTGDARLIMAAAQYADDYAIGVDGVRGERLGMGVQTDYATTAGGYTQAQLDALQRVREVAKAVGMIAGVMLYDSVILCMTARELQRKHNMKCHKTAQRRVTAALEALADYYERPKKVNSR